MMKPRVTSFEDQGERMWEMRKACGTTVSKPEINSPPVKHRRRWANDVGRHMARVPEK
jgi:hypothetical protein